MEYKKGRWLELDFKKETN